MENNKQETIRFAILGGVAAVVFLIFFYQLIMIQIAQGEYYKDKATAGTTTRQMVSAVRGEIVDRYGRPFTTNRVGYNIILDRAYLPYGNENEVLLRLMGLMESLGQPWIDNLPISSTAPYTFIEGKETQVARLKKALEVSEYATAEDCMDWLAGDNFYRIGIYDESKKRVGDLDPVTTRKLAGVRYEMVQNAFSLENTYTFASDVGAVVRDTVLERTYMLPGIDVIETPVREYVDGTLAPHILGYTGPLTDRNIETYKADGRWYDAKKNPTGYRADEYNGKGGIESAFESELRGKRGERLITLDNRGNVEAVQETIPPTPGNTVVLTIDKDLQRAAQDALETVIKGYQANTTLRHDQGKDAEAGAAVVLDPKTGEVLAMANYPGFDMNNYRRDFEMLSKDPLKPTFNRATMGVYRPGSTYKPAMAIAGLAESVIGQHETINCTGVYFRFLPSYPAKCMHVDGPITVERALQRSCNLFFYETGWRLGIDKQNEYAKAFGLGELTGIEILQEQGRRASPQFSEAMGGEWTAGNVIQTAIGQLDHAFTPVQMAGYVGTLANDGMRMNTHLVKAIKSYDFKETIRETEIKEAERINASQEAFDVIKAGMIAATAPVGGTSGWLWNGFPLTVASKTGSPEASITRLDSSYICYIPAEDPEIAIAVIIENGGQGYTGAPVARLIAEEYFFGGSATEKVQPMGTLLP